MVEAFRRALSDGEADVAYCRVMLLGPAGVGKTSFKRGLMGESFTHNTNSTELADVVQVSRRWMTQDKMNKWCEVSEVDEIDELAKLMVIVENSLTQQSRKTQMPIQIVGSVSRFNRVEQLMESKVIQKALEKAKEINKENRSLECQPFFHLWDCGGQPVFLEVIPIFLTSHTMFLLFFNAAKKLKEPWESVYHNNGSEISEGLVNCNTLEMMERWMALVYLLQKDSGSEYQNVIQIGTRKDQLTRSEEDVRKELEEFFDGKIFIQILKKIVFVNNTTSGEHDEDPSYEEVRKIVSDFTSKFGILTNRKTPVSWVLLRKFLLLLVTDFGVNLITRDEADVIGLHCNVKPQDIPHVLRFYHELGVLLYYPQIEGLHDKIVLSPVWFVKSLGMILAPPSNTEDGLKNEWKLLRSLGVLAEQLYTHVWKECKGLNPESLIELLTHFQLAVKIKGALETNGIKYDDHRPKYFVPAVLPYSPSSSPPSDDSSLSKAAPLHITFHTTGFAIPGFFTRLSTTLLKVRKSAHPKLSLYIKDGVYHDMVKYRLESVPAVFVALTEYSNVIQINLEFDSRLPAPLVQNLCIDIKNFIDYCCKDVQQCLQQSLYSNILPQQITTFNTELKVVCQAAECHVGIAGQGKPYHYLLASEILESTIGNIVCCENEKTFRSITRKEACWIKETKMTVFVEHKQQEITHGDASVHLKEVNPIVPEEKIKSILRSNLSDIIELIPNPVKLAKDLFSKKMLAPSVKDKIVEDKTPRYDGASILMNEVERTYFRVSIVEGDLANRFYKLCDALDRQKSPALSELVKKMKSSIVAESSAYNNELTLLKNVELQKQLSIKTDKEAELHQLQIEALQRKQAEYYDSITVGKEEFKGKWEDHSPDMKDRIYKGLVQELETLRSIDSKTKNVKVETQAVSVQFDYWVPMEDLLHGARVVDEKVFYVQGSGEQFFDWAECGFSLHVPEEALLGTETCAVAVKALVAGNFKFPDNTQLISGLYAISAAREFRKPVQTTIQHCLKLERKSQKERMHFIKAHQTHKGMPYIFKTEEGGDFELNSQFGTFWQCSFSTLGTVVDLPVPVDDGDTSGSDQNEENAEVEISEGEEPEDTTDDDDDESGSVLVNNEDGDQHEDTSRGVIPINNVATDAERNSVAETNEEEVLMNDHDTTNDRMNDDSSSTDRNHSGTEDDILYHALTFYEQKAPNRYVHRFVAVKSLQTHIKFVTSSPNFSSLEADKAFQFCFKNITSASAEPCVTLQFNEDRGNGWHVQPNCFPSRITKQEIELLGQELQIQGQDDTQVYPTVPMCQTKLHADPGTTANLTYPLVIEGMKQPMTIYIHRYVDDQEQSHFSQPTTNPTSNPVMTSVGTTPIPNAAENQKVHADESKSSTHNDPDTIKSLVNTIRGAFTKNVSNLTSLLDTSISVFAREMLQEGLINHAVARNNPAYHTIIDQFMASLNFIKEQTEVEQMCSKFFNILHSIGGPCKMASETMMKDLVEEVKTKLHIDLNIGAKQTYSIPTVHGVRDDEISIGNARRRRTNGEKLESEEITSKLPHQPNQPNSQSKLIIILILLLSCILIWCFLITCYIVVF